MSGEISSAGELICQRTLEKTATGFAPGQHAVRLLDPHPHRDRADFGAALTYVDSDGLACSLLCIRERDIGAWRAYKLQRAGLTKMEPSTAVIPPLDATCVAALEDAAAAATPYPFVPPSEDQLRWRRMAERLWERTAPSSPVDETPEDES